MSTKSGTISLVMRFLQIIKLLSCWISVAIAIEELSVCRTSDLMCMHTVEQLQQHRESETLPTDNFDISNHSHIIGGNNHKAPHSPCGLYLAPSMNEEATVGLFAGTWRRKGERLQEPDVMVPFPDVNKNEWSPWQDQFWEAEYAPGVHFSNEFLLNLFVPGIASLASCAPTVELMNVVVAEDDRKYDALGVHRSSHSAAGAFTYHYGYNYQALKDIQPGDELIMSCKVQTKNMQRLLTSTACDGQEFSRPGRQIEWIQEYGVCVDVFEIKPSTIPGIGRGAFLKRDSISVGEVITTTPLIHLDRSQMHIYEQTYQGSHLIRIMRDHGISYTIKIKQRQLLLNYCFGHPDSTVLLLPTAPGVNVINHSREKVNAYIRWSINENLFDTSYPMLDMLHFDMLDEQAGQEHQLAFDIVAMRDIQQGEEVFLDYGDKWMTAWEEHESSWKPRGKEHEYVSAADYVKQHAGESIRTVEEQQDYPYPDNLETACYFVPRGGDLLMDTVAWNDGNFDCLRLCSVLSRKGESNDAMYTALVLPRPGVIESNYCNQLPDEGVMVTNLPSRAVTLVDGPYTTDVFLQDAFRHEIGTPEGMYPGQWMMTDPFSKGDFIPTPLKPFEIQPIRWSETGEVVTPNGFRIGLNPKVRLTLLEYCKRLGIVDIFRHTTAEGNALPPGTNTYLTLNDKRWFLQRPDRESWRSNLQWLSPGEKSAHDDYLQALSVAEFDDVLDSIGSYFDMDGLVAYQVTFIAVSSSTKGYLHYDVTNTGSKTFNIIIPLILANQTGPEVDIQDRPDDIDEGEEHALRVGRYRYEYDVAIMMGDDAYHATSAADYRLTGEMRLAATIYVSDVNDENVDNIVYDYTQAYPPQDRNLLLRWAGRHWKRNDPMTRLPQPSADHILVAPASNYNISKTNALENP